MEKFNYYTEFYQLSADMEIASSLDDEELLVCILAALKEISDKFYSFFIDLFLKLEN